MEGDRDEAPIDGLTDEAVLHYKLVTAEKKLDPRSVGRPILPDAGAPLAATGAGAAVITFADQELHASIAGAPDEDPWGLGDEDALVPGAVTRADDSGDERKRRSQHGIAVRGSGTRGGRGAGGAPGGGAPMMAPAASVGGVGAPAGGVAPGAMAQGGSVVSLQSAGAAQGAASSMPVTLISNAQNSSRAAGGSAFAPPMSGGLQAASSAPGVYDPELVRQALHQNGFGVDEADPASAASAAQGDTDDSRRGGDPRATSPGGAFPGLPIGTAPGGAPAGPSGPGGNSGAATGPGGTTGGATGGGTGPSTSGSTGSPGPNGPTGGSGTTGTTTPPGTNGSHGSDSWNNPPSGPLTSGNDTSTVGARPTKGTPSYTGGSGTDYTVAPSDLRRDSQQWADVADLSAPIVDAMLEAPDPAVMFGHMRAPVPAYKVAFDTSRTFVEQSSNHQEEIAERLAETAANFDKQEELAVEIAEGMNK